MPSNTEMETMDINFSLQIPMKTHTQTAGIEGGMQGLGFAAIAWFHFSLKKKKVFDESIALETQKGEKKSVKLNHKHWGLLGTDSPLLWWAHIPSCYVPMKESLLPEGETLEGVCVCL